MLPLTVWLAIGIWTTWLVFADGKKKRKKRKWEWKKHCLQNRLFYNTTTTTTVCLKSLSFLNKMRMSNIQQNKSYVINMCMEDTPHWQKCKHPTGFGKMINVHLHLWDYFHFAHCIFMHLLFDQAGLQLMFFKLKYT